MGCEIMTALRFVPSHTRLRSMHSVFPAMHLCLEVRRLCTCGAMGADRAQATIFRATITNTIGRYVTAWHGSCLCTGETLLVVAGETQEFLSNTLGIVPAERECADESEWALGEMVCIVHDHMWHDRKLKIVQEARESVWEAIADAWERFKGLPAVKTGVQVCSCPAHYSNPAFLISIPISSPIKACCARQRINEQHHNALVVHHKIMHQSLPYSEHI